MEKKKLWEFFNFSFKMRILFAKKKKLVYRRFACAILSLCSIKWRYELFIDVPAKPAKRGRQRWSNNQKKKYITWTDIDVRKIIKKISKSQRYIITITCLKWSIFLFDLIIQTIAIFIGTSSSPLFGYNIRIIIPSVTRKSVCKSNI